MKTVFIMRSNTKRVTCFTYVVNLTFTTGPWENAAPKVGQFVQPPEVMSGSSVQARSNDLKSPILSHLFRIFLLPSALHQSPQPPEKAPRAKIIAWDPVLAWNSIFPGSG